MVHWEDRFLLTHDNIVTTFKLYKMNHEEKLVQHLAVEKLREALKSHDWHYERSDDPKVYRRGRDESNTIRSLINTIGDEKFAISLYNKYCPWINSKDEVTPISDRKEAPTLEEKCIEFLKQRNYYISKQKS